MTTRAARDRVWAMFRAAEPKSFEQHVEEALGLVQHWPTEPPKRTLYALCGEILGTAEDYPCLLPSGHNGMHQVRTFTWGER